MRLQNNETDDEKRFRRKIAELVMETKDTDVTPDFIAATLFMAGMKVCFAYNQAVIQTEQNKSKEESSDESI